MAWLNIACLVGDPARQRRPLSQRQGERKRVSTSRHDRFLQRRVAAGRAAAEGHLDARTRRDLTPREARDFKNPGGPSRRPPDGKVMTDFAGMTKFELLRFSVGMSMYFEGFCGGFGTAQPRAGAA